MLYSELTAERSTCLKHEYIELTALQESEIEALKRLNANLTELDHYIFHEVKKIHGQRAVEVDHLGKKFTDQEFGVEVQFYFK